MNSAIGMTQAVSLRSKHWMPRILAVALFLSLASSTLPAQPVSPTGQGISRDDSIPAAQLIEPADLAKMLHASNAKGPLILQVGSHVLFSEAHIQGAEYAGAAAKDAGLQSLRQRVQSLPRDKFLIIYCGCCPWDRCPNIRPAYRELTTMGFTHLKVLYLKDNFGADWVEKGYPTTKGE